MHKQFNFVCPFESSIYINFLFLSVKSTMIYFLSFTISLQNLQKNIRIHPKSIYNDYPHFAYDVRAC